MNNDNYYNYLSIALLCGPYSPYLKSHSYFFQSSKMEKEIKFSEIIYIGESGKQETLRRVSIKNGTTIETSNIMTNGLAVIIMLKNEENKINVSDALFSDENFKMDNNDWKETINNTLKHIKWLIMSLYEKDLCNIPLLIRDMNNISLTLMRYWKVLF